MEIQACQWRNNQIGKQIDVFGIVTNGDTWKAYKLAIAGGQFSRNPLDQENGDTWGQRTKRINVYAKCKNLTDINIKCTMILAKVLAMKSG